MELAKLHKLSDVIVIEFHDKVRALSSTVYGSGFRELTHVIFKTVNKDFNNPNPRAYAEQVVRELGLPLNSTAVFLTAVNVTQEHVVREIKKPIPVMLVATIGLSNPACICKENIESIKYTCASTINILVVTEYGLSDNAFVDLVGVVSGAKALALTNVGLTCSLSRRAFGTVTDAVIVASCMKEKTLPYGGPATKIGSLVGKLVYETILHESLRKLKAGDKFKNIYGLSIEELERLCLKIYSYAPIPQVPINRVVSIIRREIERILYDPNIWSIAIALRELEIRGNTGTIPELSVDEYISDSPKIIADEILGIALSMYINGWKGMFCYYWIERIKDKVEELKKLPMFTDDLVCSLIGAILSKVYDELIPR